MEVSEQLLPSEPHDRGAPKDGSYSSDSDGLRAAAKDLTATRDKEPPVVEVKADLLPTVYEESGEDTDGALEAGAGELFRLKFWHDQVESANCLMTPVTGELAPKLVEEQGSRGSNYVTARLERRVGQQPPGA